jgi:hypothetical protein
MEERHLRKVCGVGLVLALVAAFALQVGAQKSAPPPRPAPLVLTGAIPLPKVKGRIDHRGFDPAHNQLFLSALGNTRKRLSEPMHRQLCSCDFWIADSAWRCVLTGDEQAVREK